MIITVKARNQQKPAVIFDLDGTIFKTREVVLPAVKDALSDVGLSPAEDEKIISLLGEKTDEFCRQLAGDDDEETLSQFIERLGHYEAIYIREYGELYPRTKEILQYLRDQGYIIAMCSNGSEEYVEYVLHTMDIRSFFDSISSGQNHLSKGVMIEEILQQLGAEEGVMIGDSPHDIQGAKEAGIPSIGVLYGYGDVSEATYKVRSLMEIKGVLESLSS